MSQSTTAFDALYPPAWLGVVGGGQLGRMFCQAAQRMGYQVAVLDPDPQSPTGQIAHKHFCAAYDDEQALQEMGQLCAAVTTEFENVPARTLQLLGQYTRVAPDADAVALTQDRAVEKRFLQQAGAQVAPFLEVTAASDLEHASAELFPGILKTARFGYDGKGQVRVADISAAQQAFAALQQVPCVLEAQLPLEDEISVVLVRGADGQVRYFDPAHNEHREGILAVSRIQEQGHPLYAQAQQMAQQIASAAAYVGVLCVEFFVLADGQLVANEIAPRPHNSGHHTIEACLSSQFEQQVRALAGLPLGATTLRQPAVMVNILGDSWFLDSAPDAATETEQPHTPDWAAVQAIEGVFLHLYGKAEPRRGRKMGHLTVLGETVQQAEQRAQQAAAVLGIDL